jgi:hypothetical protein
MQVDVVDEHDAFGGTRVAPGICRGKRAHGDRCERNSSGVRTSAARRMRAGPARFVLEHRLDVVESAPREREPRELRERPTASRSRDRARPPPDRSRGAIAPRITA